MNVTKYLCLFLLALPLYSQTDSSNQINCSCNCINRQFDILPDSFFIGAPNPFSPTTHEVFGIPEQAMVEFRIFDVNNNLIKESGYCYLQQGYYRFVWGNLFGDWNSVCSGVYLIKMKAYSTENFKIMFEGEKKLIIVK